MKPSPPNTSETALRHELTTGQIVMVAVGSSIGTGLLLGSGAAIQVAGPAIFVSYIIGAWITFAVAMALGELASRHPGAGSFGIYADLYVNRWAGFVARYGYMIGILFSISAELIASATYARFWFPHSPSILWIAICSALLLFINLREIGNFGRFEYWFAMIKVVVIFAFILLGAGLLFNGLVVPHYTIDGGFLARGATGPLLAVSFALFSFFGIELFAISSGESISVAAVRKATYQSFGLLAFLYVATTAVLAGVLSWKEAGVGQSPFVTVFEIAKIPAASHIMNFAVLTAALSGSNASLYGTSRMLYSLSLSGYAPGAFGKVDRRGVPRNAVLVCTLGILAAMIVSYYAPENAYLYLIGASLFGGMLAWGISLIAHVRMRSRLSPAELAALPMRAPGGRMTSLLAFAALIAVIVSTWWVPQARTTILSAGPYLLLLSAFYWIAKKFARDKRSTEASPNPAASEE